MAINYNNTVKNARLEVVADALSAGDGPGKIQIGTAGMAQVLVEVEIDDPPGVADQVLTLLAEAATAQALASGTAGAARLVDSDDNVVASGLTVGLSAADVILDSLSITENQNTTVNSATISHP